MYSVCKVNLSILHFIGTITLRSKTTKTVEIFHLFIKTYIQTTSHEQLTCLHSISVDDESVLDIALQRAHIGLVDLARLDQLDVAHDVVAAAEVQHLLGLADASNV